MPNIDQSEIDDFLSIVNSKSYSFGDFELVEIECPAPLDGVHLIKGKVEVTFRETCVTRIYDTGDRSKWLSEFSNDLQSGEFSIRI